MSAPATISVVLVEDHDLLADNLVRLLEADGDIHVLAVATTVAEAVATVAEHRPDLVVMDHRLPDGTGIDATTQIKSQRPELPVILLSGALDDSIRADAAAAGCAVALEKAASVTTELVATVRSLVT